MKTIEDIRLEQKLSDKMLTFIEMAVNNYDDLTTSDLQGMCEALAINIIREVRGE
jgi:hypothetical protein